MSNNDVDGELVSITTQLEKLVVASSDSAKRLRANKVKAEKLRRDIEQGQSELTGIQRRIHTLKDAHDKVITSNEAPPARDEVGRTINGGATVVIANRYTNFSTRFPKSKANREPKIRGVSVQYYDCDKFDTVTYIQRAGRRGSPASKIYFVTDSGFETWRKPKNLLDPS